VGEVESKRYISTIRGYGPPNLREVQHAAHILGFEIVGMLYDESGDRTKGSWIPRWHFTLEATRDFVEAE
jgi:hypothetical protein